jgi:outer membrane protein assembly factor BamD
MTFSPHVRLARYRICQSYEKSSPKFYFDQDATDRAIQKYQEFIEDFPDSEYRDEATATIRELRNKLSQKMYESAILYVKMEEYDAAVNYLKDLLELYFDTNYADKARLLIVDTFIVARKFEEAETFLEKNGGGFIDVAVLEEAKMLIEKNRPEEKK